MKNCRAGLLTILIISLFSKACSFLYFQPAAKEKTRFKFVLQSRLELPRKISGNWLTARDKIYLASEDGEILAVDAKAEKIAWTFKANEAVEIKFGKASRGCLFYTPSKTIYFLSEDGRLNLSKQLDDLPTAIGENKNLVVVCTESGEAVAVDAVSGSNIWQKKLSRKVVHNPVFSENLIMLVDESGSMFALNYEGKIIWTFSERTIVGEPVYDKKIIYFGTAGNYFYAVRESTGKTKWRHRLAGELKHQPYIWQDKLVAVASNSVVYCLNKKTGEIIWWQPVKSRLINAPAISNGLILISADLPAISVYDVHTGLEAEPVGTQDSPLAQVACSGSRLIVLTSADFQCQQVLLFYKLEFANKCYLRTSVELSVR